MDQASRRIPDGTVAVSALRVVIADDHALLRQAVAALLESDADTRVVAAVERADDLIAAVDTHRPDAVLTDIRMPPGDGLDGIASALEIRRRHPDTGVVVLSQHLEHGYVTGLFAQGTQGLGYLLKERIGDRDQLVQALRETAAGGSVIDPRVVEALVAARVRAERSPLAALSGRELEVLELMAEGASNPAIARRLYLSLSSIEKHVSSIFSTLGLSQEATTHRRVAAVLAFLRNS